MCSAASSQWTLIFVVFTTPMSMLTCTLCSMFLGIERTNKEQTHAFFSAEMNLHTQSIRLV